jgi:hypothetical protein
MNDSQTVMGNSRRILLIGIAVFSVIFGAWTFFASFFPNLGNGYHFFWILIFALCTLVVIRGKRYLFNIGVILRFTLVVAIGVVFIWQNPWTIFGGLAIDRGMAIWLVALVFALCISGVLFLVLAATTKTIPKPLPQFLVKYLLILLAVSLVFYFITIVETSSFMDTAPQILYLIINYFIHSMIMQLIFGFAYYFVTVSFLGEVRYFGGETLERKVVLIDNQAATSNSSQPMDEDRDAEAPLDKEVAVLMQKESSTPPVQEVEVFPAQADATAPDQEADG